VLLQPQHALRVEMVGRLVQQQQVRLGQQQLAQRHPAPLTAGKARDVGVPRWATQRVHRLLQLRLQIPGVRVVEVLLQPAHFLHQLIGVVGGHQLGDLVEPVQLLLDLADALLHVAEDRLVLVERRLLLQDPHRVPGRQDRVTVVRLVKPRHDAQHGGLTGAVGSDHADLRPWVEGEGDVVEDDLVAVRLAHLPHDVNELGHARDGSCVASLGCRPGGRQPPRCATRLCPCGRPTPCPTRRGRPLTCTSAGPSSR
jgi:hypothetical protein